jgi:hypothetical protein
MASDVIVVVSCRIDFRLSLALPATLFAGLPVDLVKGTERSPSSVVGGQARLSGSDAAELASQRDAGLLMQSGKVVGPAPTSASAVIDQGIFRTRSSRASELSLDLTSWEQCVANSSVCPFGKTFAFGFRPVIRLGLTPRAGLLGTFLPVARNAVEVRGNAHQLDQISRGNGGWLRGRSIRGGRRFPA